MADRIQHRRDTAERWKQYNPILLEGEVGYELDTDQYKLGDGEHAWNDLPYRGDPCLQQTGPSTTTPMSQKAVTDELNTINGKISAIASGAEVRLSLNVSCIYKNVATAVTITANVTGITPETLKIMEDSLSGTVLQSGNNVKTLTANKTFTLTSNTKNLFGLATYQGLEFSGSVTLNARYPIYYGFGSSPESVAVDANKLSARTSAAGTYNDTATADGQHFYILVPTDINALSNFTMGGAPYVMNSSTKSISGVNYSVYTSGAVYNSGATVSVVAS